MVRNVARGFRPGSGMGEPPMKKIVLIYGCISGVMIATLMSLSLVFSKRIGYGHSMLLGYTIMVASFLLVYFGVRSYRDTEGGGEISFGRAMAVGSLIMLITCVFYVASWEVLYFNFMPHFMDDYGAHTLAKMQASGASQAAIAKQAAAFERMNKMYQNVFYNSAMTFIEPLPVGVLMTGVSAVLLRRKNKSEASTSGVMAA